MFIAPHVQGVLRRLRIGSQIGALPGISARLCAGKIGKRRRQVGLLKAPVDRAAGQRPADCDQRDACERAVLPVDRKAPLLGLSLLRSEAAWSYLLELVRAAAPERARQAIEALAVFRHDAALRERVLAAAEARERDLQRFARQTFAAEDTTRS